MTISQTTPAAATTAHTADGRLPRQLGAWSTTAVTIGIMIGSGIFRVPAVVAAAAGTPESTLLVWVVGGLVAMCGALALAEVAALYPDAGGMYVYLREAFGPLTAFLFGWLYLIVMPAGAGAIALVFAEYLGRLLPLATEYVRAVAGALILLLAAAQYRSVRFGAAIQNASTIAKVLAILAMAMAAVLLGAPGAGAWSGGSAAAAATWSGFGLGIVAVLWAYNGWQDVTCLSGEVRDPGRSLPRAIVGGTLTVVAVYLIANAAYLRVLTIDEIARSPLVAADLSVRLVGPAGSALIAALVCVSTLGALNAVIMAIPRVFWAMAEDGLFFRTVAAVHPRYRTPHMAIASLAGLSILYLAFRSFEQLIEAFVLASLPFWALGGASVIVLRRRQPALPRPYRVPGYPLVPLLFMAAMVALVANSLWEHPETTAASLGAIAAGVPLYYGWRRFGSRG